MLFLLFQRFSWVKIRRTSFQLHIFHKSSKLFSLVYLVEKQLFIYLFFCGQYGRRRDRQTSGAPEAQSHMVWKQEKVCQLLWAKFLTRETHFSSSQSAKSFLFKLFFYFPGSSGSTYVRKSRIQERKGTMNAVFSTQGSSKPRFCRLFPASKVNKNISGESSSSYTGSLMVHCVFAVLQAEASFLKVHDSLLWRVHQSTGYSDARLSRWRDPRRDSRQVKQHRQNSGSTAPTWLHRDGLRHRLQ